MAELTRNSSTRNKVETLRRYWPEGTALLLFIGIAIWTVLNFGSPRNAWLYASGVRLLVEPAAVSVSEGKAGETKKAAFSARNLTGRAVTILGVESTCICLSTDELPMTIPPGGSRDLHVSLHLDVSAPGKVAQSLTYFTDLSSISEFRVVVSGVISDR